jgi:2-polyprenyl-3-methyl-5-hydroxy-6-metoxy-1,4-benzoquinol methylase
LHEQTQRNLDYYDRLTPGRADYWRYMAAPRFRVRVICDILRDARPRSVIDLGCGDGALLNEIRKTLPDAAVAGVDLSPSQIEANRASTPDVAWYARDIERDPLDVGSRFEALTCSEVVEHLAEPVRFLHAARQLAADRALLVVSTQSGRVGVTERRVGHLRHFTAHEMSALLVEAGWEPLRVWNAGFPFHDWSKRLANLSPDTMLAEFGETAYGPAKRSISAVLRLLFLLNSNSRGAQLFAVARLKER